MTAPAPRSTLQCRRVKCRKNISKETGTNSGEITCANVISLARQLLLPAIVLIWAFPICDVSCAMLAWTTGLDRLSNWPQGQKKSLGQQAVCKSHTVHQWFRIETLKSLQQYSATCPEQVTEVNSICIIRPAITKADRVLRRTPGYHSDICLALWVHTLDEREIKTNFMDWERHITFDGLSFSANTQKYTPWIKNSYKSPCNIQNTWRYPRFTTSQMHPNSLRAMAEFYFQQRSRQ